MIMNMLTEVRRRTHKQSKTFSIDKIPGIIELENTISELKTSTDVMPDVRNPEREERRPPRQCSSQKGKFIADLSQGSCHIQRSGVGSESPEPKLLHKFIGWAHAVGSWFKRIGYKFAKQFIGQNFHALGTFLGVSTPFLIGKQWSVLSWLVVSTGPDNFTTQK